MNLTYGKIILVCCCMALLASCISRPQRQLYSVSRGSLAVEFIGEKVEEFPLVTRIDVVVKSKRATYIPENAGSLGLDICLTNCVAPDGGTLVLPIGLTEGLAVFRVDDGLLDKVSQRKPDDCLRMCFIRPDSGRCMPVCIYFAGWSSHSTLEFLASADDYTERYSYDCATGLITGPLDAVFKRRSLGGHRGQTEKRENTD